jgi:hypothetical protein
MGWRNAFWAGMLVALALLAPASALAAPPTNVTVSENAGRLAVSWDLALNSLSSAVEIAHSAKTAANGSFSDPGKISASVDESDSTYTSPPLANGTWYVHVASYDPTSPSCTYVGGDLKCKTEYSSTVTARVGSGSPGGDTSTAFATLRVPSKQKAAKLRVQASMGENGTITVGGTLNVPNAAKVYRLKAVSVSAAAGKTVTVRVKLTKQALKAVRKALLRHRKVKASLTITAKDGAGNTKTAKRAVRLTG